MLEIKNVNPGLFNRALHSLWTICGKREVLPRPYIIPEGLSRTSEKEFASGGYSNVWRGTLVRAGLHPRRVCIKIAKVAVSDREEARNDIEKVRNSPSPPFARSLDSWLLGILPGSRDMDAIEASECCQVPRRHSRATPDSDGSDVEWRGDGLHGKEPQR